MCFQGCGRGAIPMGPAHNVDQVFYLGKYPASSAIGLGLGTPEVSISSVCSRPSLLGSPAPSWIPQTLSFCQDLGPVFMFHGHVVWGTPFVVMCVHMCSHMCMCSMHLFLLSHLAIKRPRCPCHGCHLPSPGNAGATAGQGLLCGTECEPSLDGLLDLFN